MEKSKNNLGKYDLNQLLRDPSLIHKIQDNLTSLKGSDLLTEAYRSGAIKDLGETMRQIVSDYRDNSKMTTEIVGEKTLKMIEEYKGITLADDLPNKTFGKTK